MRRRRLTANDLARRLAIPRTFPTSFASVVGKSVNKIMVLRSDLEPKIFFTLSHLMIIPIPVTYCNM